MKYLESFSSYYKVPSSNTEELKYYCLINLVYLLDDDEFELVIYDKKIAYPGHFLIMLNKKSKKIDEIWFKWQDISDYYIAFVNRLSREYNQYEIEIEIKFKDNRGQISTRKVKEIDSLNPNEELIAINLLLKE